MKKRLALLVAFVVALSIVFALPVSAESAIPENGFYEDEFGRWYFYRDGEMVINEVIQYGDYFYAFNSWGRMYEDQSFSIQVEVEGDYGTYYDYTYYRAKPGGPLCVNEWYWDEWDECWYYYGENGAAPSYEFLAVNGTTYYFMYEGRMMADGAEWVYGGEIASGYFAFDENGAYEPIDLNAVGWQEHKGNWYYVEKDEYGHLELAYNKCLNIDGTNYLFNDRYAMATDEFVELWNQETHVWDYYYANAYGQPHTGWIQPYVNDTDHPNYEYIKDNWYYYGADGKTLMGYNIVDGTGYYFYNDGEMSTDGYGIFYGEDANYAWVTDKNGVASYTNKGWLKFNETWRYFDGEEWLRNGLYEIDGNYYYFRYEDMLDDDTYDLYRAKEGGILYRNEWYAENSGWYYYGDQCEKLTNTVAEINGVYYAFDYNGRMKKNQIAFDDFGYAYILDENGVGTLVTGTGWFAVDDAWVYAEDGQLVRDGWKTIDGSDYYFEGIYILQDTYWYAEEDAYLFSAGGAKITDIGWHVVDGEWYYVKEAGGAIANGGWYEVDGRWYYFYPEMAHNTVLEDYETGYVYGFDTNGAYFQVTGDGFYTSWPGNTMYIKNNVLSKNTWEFVDGSWYYFDEGGYKAHGAADVDGTLYLFTEEGRLVYDSWCEVYGGVFRSNAEGKVLTGYQYVDGKYYLFRETGALYYGGVAEQDGYTYLLHDDGSVYGYAFTPNTWYYVDGCWYYFADGYFLREIIKEVDGFVYAFDYSGQMVVDEEYYGKYNNYWDAYYFDEAGHMARNAWRYTPYGYQYYDEDGEQYYYGYYTIGGVEYCFDSYLQIGTFVHEGDLVSTTEGGAVISKTPMSDGWTYSDGKYYYVVDGDYNYTGWVGQYYVNYGEMVYYSDVYDRGNYYYIDTNGVYVNGGWYNIGSAEYPEYIYANPDGTLMYNEWAEIGGVRYYFSGYHMCADGIYWIDGESHEFAESGAWLGQVEENTNNGYENGWVYLDGEYYYSYNGQFLSGNQYIDGAWYRFGYYYYEEYSNKPAMLADVYFDGLYYTASGALLEAAGWQIINGYYVYFDGDHYAKTGLIEVDGVQYFITGKVINEGTEDAKVIYYMVSNGYVVYGGELYYAAASGALTKVTDANGWYWIENWQNYAYGQNGELLCGGEYVINGITYGFYSDGEMVADARFNGAYYDASGAKATATGWYWSDSYNGWLYVNNGELYSNGIYYINGAGYYFSGVVWVQ